MRHKVDRRKLNRPTDQRVAMLRNIVKALIIHESVNTTVTRAKEARRLAERVISLARNDSVHNRRQVSKLLGSERQPTPAERKAGRTKVDPVRKLFDTLGPAYADRERGGYCRITRTGPRRGDSTMMAKLELMP
ncbi:MAG: 50S ribosomal protein L17 [Armatimonadia bacterium]|nr:50S ribosomal protein L17 [Armatimonadia bacterium]